MRIFVYGTLRRGECSHHLLKDARFVADANTTPAFTLVNLGSYPGLLLGGETAVRGEVYEVTLRTLARLDLFEEVPEVYRRITQLIDGKDTWLYALRPDHAAAAPAIESGDWCDR